jgi:hypothetical protein
VEYRTIQPSPSLGKLTEAELDAAIACKFAPPHDSGACRLAPLRPPIPLVFRAACGSKRPFLSQRDAAAYDRGYRQHPHDCYAEPGTPEAIGWADARDEGAAGMDDMADWAKAHPAECGVHLP